MRSSNLDKYVCIAVFSLFLYSFFFIGAEYVFCEDIPFYGYHCREDEVAGINWPTSVYIAPIAFMMFLGLILFRGELEPVNRLWMRKKIRYDFRIVRNKIRSGIAEYRDWRH